MYYLVYDSTFEGYLTSVFQVYERRLDKDIRSVSIVRRGTDLADLFRSSIEIDTNSEQSERVSTRLVSVLGKKGRNALWRAWLSGLPDAEQIILDVIQYALRTQRNILRDYTNTSVMRLSRILKMVSRERHRMTAFVRFKKDEQGLFFATIEPDYDVLPLISSHFVSRYADQRWMIFDMKRGYGLYHEEGKVLIVEQGLSPAEGELPEVQIDLDTSEEHYQDLWKGYYHHTDIKGRRNMKLHLRHVPRRYWKYLVEKELGLP